MQALLFLLLFCFGITGSSFGLVSTIGLTESNEVKLIGEYRPIRSDEWAVGTLLSIAQFNNADKLPIVNRNLGESGKKLAIAHDTGVPVSELASIAKPATWGFHLFDLRHALSWYWLIPLLISINGTWLLLNTIWERQTITNFVLSIALTFSPHSVVWSFWPSFQIGLAGIATSSFLLILKSNVTKRTLLLSLCLGVSLAAFTLTLYLPRLIPIVTLLLLLVIAYLFQNGQWKALQNKVPYLMLALFFYVGILFSWYINNSDAILSIINSTYPGLRRVYGGDFGLWDFIRGWLTPITITSYYGISNECELASYLNLLIPIMIFSAFFYKKLRLVELSILFFLGFAIYYQYFGLPKWLGAITFWDRSLPSRIDIGIELAQFLFFAAMFSRYEEFTLSMNWKLFFSVLIPILILLMIWFSAPSPFLNANTIGYGRALMVLLLIAVLHISIFANYKYFPILLMMGTLIITANWHPLGIAPSYLKIDLPSAMSDKSLPNNGKILVATGDHVIPNLIAATGLKVWNVTSHYIDPEIYKDFYESIDDGSYKKFNHMRISINNEQSDFTIKSQGDCIDWVLNGKLYDFRKLPVDFIIARNDDGLLINKTVKLIDKKNDFYIFQVVR